MQKYFYILFTCLYSCSNNFQLKEGDLLFQDLDSGPLCEAIELVTTGYNNGNFSHIGLIVNSQGKLKVLEAIPPKVTLSEIEDFLSRSKDKDKNPKVIVGRLKNCSKVNITKAITFANKKIGENYDDLFLVNNGSYYCSELIYEAFLEDSVFTLQPMNFLSPNSNDTLKIWKDYYSKRGFLVPQNQLGINPGIMSLSDKLNIVHIYGIPNGMEK